MVSYYNGKEYKFDIYTDRFYSTTSQFDDEGNTNPHEIWKAKRYKDDGTTEEFDNIIYYTKTDKPNGVKIIMDVKNPIRNKQKFFDAVKSQLTYFPYVRFYEEWEEEDRKWRNDEIVFKTEILYEDEHLIIPKENYYAVPHLVLNGVNYGVIDFSEMEMDEKKGNIGIIGDPNEIDVNQSRESVRYTEKTRNAIKKYLANSIKVAQNFVNAEMENNQEDFIKWTISCRDLRAKNSRDNILSRLSGLADLSSVEFTHVSGIKYNQTNFKKVFSGFRITRTSVHHDGNVFKTNTVDVHSWENFTPELLFYRESSEDRISSITMGYIVQEIQTLSNDVFLITPTELDSSVDLEIHETVNNLILESPTFKDYSEVLVPDQFIEDHKSKQKEFEEKEQERRIEASLTEKELRKRNGLILYHRFLRKQSRYGNIHCLTLQDSHISKTRREISLDDIKSEFSRENTVYGTSEDIPLLKTLLHIPNRFDPSGCSRFDSCIWSNNFKIIVVSKEVVKYIDSYATHVKEALQTVSNTKISVMTKIKQYNTARLFKHIPEDHNFKFLELFNTVDELAHKVYTKLCSYTRSNGFRTEWSNALPGAEEVNSYLDNLREFQLFLIEEKDPKKVAEKSKELFNTEVINSCDALDMFSYVQFKAIEDYIEDMKALLRPYSYNTSYDGFDFNAVREYINLKGIPDYLDFLTGRCEEFEVSLSTVLKQINSEE